MSSPDRSRELDQVCALLTRYYVFPDVGEQVVELLRRRHSAGAFPGVSTDEEFGIALTHAMQTVNGDRHLRLLYSVDEIPVQDGEDSEVFDEVAYRQEVLLSAGGIAAAQRLDGNVGYLDIRTLHDANIAAPIVSAAMTLLAGTDVLIIDLRRCPGGSPLMVAHYCSYLFDDPTHLNDIYDRPSDQTRQFWTAPSVPGAKFGGSKPVYVLTSSTTFSGAEEFSYDLQSRGRARVVGEQTKGGAHPGARYRIGPHLQLAVPQGRAINPVTGTNWEGCGVRPDVDVSAEDAFDTAYGLALEHAFTLGREGARRAVVDEAEAAREGLCAVRR
ncbi:MAG: S41 family peptidase [Geodermatophilaceae bacterium]|nr:S41 family peptidase [Geodermatophilaceae bacterium]